MTPARASDVKQPWRADAACRGAGPAEFYPPPSVNVSPSIRAMCAGCSVRPECLDAVLAEERSGVRHGYRAGLSPEERDSVVRRLRRDTRLGRVVDLLALADKAAAKWCRSCGARIGRGRQLCEACADGNRLQYFADYDEARREARRRSWRESKRRKARGTGTPAPTSTDDTMAS